MKSFRRNCRACWRSVQAVEGDRTSWLRRSVPWQVGRYDCQAIDHFAGMSAQDLPPAPKSVRCSGQVRHIQPVGAVEDGNDICVP